MTAERALTREEAAALLCGPRGKELHTIATSYTAPLCWEKLSERGDVQVQTGTAFFLDTGPGPFAVTARHVYQEYRAAKTARPETVCNVGKLPMDLDGRLISQHEQSGDGPDIATFRIEPDEVNQLRKRALTYRRCSWPPAPPRKGNAMFFAGYPGRRRVVGADDEIQFGVLCGLLAVSTVNDRNICCQIGHELLETPQHARVTREYDLQGLSGAPLLALVEHNGISSWRLSGVIYTAHMDWRIVFAARADFIRSDGQVKPYDWIQRRTLQN